MPCPLPRPEDEVVRICRELIRIDSVQLRRRLRPGGARGGRVRHGASSTEVGLDADLLESEPGRASVVVRLEGDGPHRGPAWRSTATSTSSRRTPPTGRSTRSPPRSATAASGVAAPST